MRRPFPIVAEIAPGADPSASPATWDWTSEDVRWRIKAGISITSGRDDEDDETKPGSAEATFDNRHGHLSPRNVLGKWFGELRRNTPLRFTLDSVNDDFSRVTASGWGTEPQSGLTWLHSIAANWSTNGSSGQYSTTTPNSVQLGVLNGSVGYDVDVYNTAAISAVPTGGAWVHATVLRRVDNLNNYRLYTEFGTDNKIYVKVIRQTGSGTTTELVGSTDSGVTYVVGDEIHTHAQAIGRTLQIRVWKNNDPEPTVWHASADDSRVRGTTVGVYEWRIATNVGSLGITVDNFRVVTSLFTGQIPELPVRWPEKSGTDCTVPVAASGILRWLEQTDPPLTDPISQQLSAQNPQGYWTLQDGSDAKAGGSTLPRPRGVPASGVDVTFGNDDAPPGATSSASLNTLGTSAITGNVPSWTSGSNGFAAMAFVRFPALPGGTAVTLLSVRAVGRITRWIVQVDTSTFNVRGFDEDGTELVTSGGSVYAIDPTKWFALQLETVEVGANTEWDLIWHQVGSTTFYVTSGTVAGACDRVTQVKLLPGVDGTLVSHLWVGPNTLPFVDNDFMQVSNGYAGETDTDRIARIFDQAGIEVAVGTGTGIQLGPQPRNATVLQAARDAEKAGWGVLYERGAILAYLPYSERINVPVAMELDWAQGHLDEAPEPADDDLELVNRWTSRRPNGSERTAEDADSIAAERLYADGDEVNVWTDEQLNDDAGWHVAVGARDVLRWPRIKINLAKNPDLIPAWLGLTQGSRVTIANLPGQVAGEVADLFVIGDQQDPSKYEWTAEISTAPAYPWTNVGVWGTARGDSTSTTLAEDLDATETGVNITSVYLEDTWASAGGYIWNINGEPMSVTSVTSPAGSAGAYTQTATVVRSTTLAKAHPSGKPVHLDRSQQVRWGLRH